MRQARRILWFRQKPIQRRSRRSTWGPPPPRAKSAPWYRSSSERARNKKNGRSGGGEGFCSGSEISAFLEAYFPPFFFSFLFSSLAVFLADAGAIIVLMREQEEEEEDFSFPLLCAIQKCSVINEWFLIRHRWTSPTLKVHQLPPIEEPWFEFPASLRHDQAGLQDGLAEACPHSAIRRHLCKIMNHYPVAHWQLKEIIFPFLIIMAHDAAASNLPPKATVIALSIVFVPGPETITTTSLNLAFILQLRFACCPLPSSYSQVFLRW